MGERDDIPADVQRQVRRQCGFGCAICGRIGTDYEHIVPYSEVKSHDADNIVLLCPDHHGEVTRGRYPKHRVAEAKKHPFAMKEGRSAFYQYEAAEQKLFVVGAECVIANGCERFHVLVHRSTPLVTIELDEGVPLLSMRLVDHKGRTVLLIDHNRILVNAYNIWDVDLRGTRFEVRRKRGDIVLKLELIAGEIHLRRLKMDLAEATFSVNDKGKLDVDIAGGAKVHAIVRNNVTSAGREFTLFRIGQPVSGQLRIPANFAFDLPGDDDS